VVQSYREGVRFSAEDRALLEFVGSHILTALERKQSKDELEQQVRLRTIELAEANRGLQQEVLERQRAERLQAVLFHIAQLATADLDEGEFYERLHQVVGELLNAENFFIALLTDDRRSREFPYYVDAGARRIVPRQVGRGRSEYGLRSGEPLLVLEAMKMEHTITAPADGVVEAVHYQAGEQVLEGAELITLKSGTDPVFQA
jgi:acetyl/propionyl-CoA carboxylase alpha subunit